MSNRTLAVLHKKREHGSTIIVQEEEGSLKGGLAYKMFGNPDDQTENSIKSAQSEEHQRAPSDDATAYFKSKAAGSMRTTAQFNFASNKESIEFDIEEDRENTKLKNINETIDTEENESSKKKRKK